MKNRQVLLSGILVWLLYLGGRTLMQKVLPFTDWAGYVGQDLAITALRAACGASCLWLARKRWFDSAMGLGMPAKISAMAWLAMAFTLAGALVQGMAQQAAWGEALWIRAVEVAVALVVAFNEEVGYRVLILNGVRELWGRGAALLLSSLVFALMHMGYQPLFHLPKIFVIGLCFALLRDRGLSLKALILVHFLFDAVAAIALSGELIHPRLYDLSFGLAALAAIFAWLAPERHAPEGESLLFAYGSLIPGSPESKALCVERRCDVAGNGSAQGLLKTRGDYPALVPSKKSSDRVSGTLLRLRDSEFLRVLDAYEGDEYIRDKALIQMEDGSRCEAWIYVASGAHDKRVKTL